MMSSPKGTIYVGSFKSYERTLLSGHFGGSHNQTNDRRCQYYYQKRALSIQSVFSLGVGFFTHNVDLLVLSLPLS